MLAGIIDEIFAVELEDVSRARELILGGAGVSARDALHAAVMQHHGIKHILSFDSGFDACPGITRIA